MKNRILAGFAALISGGLIALGPQYLFKVCDQTHSGITQCFWTARAEIGVGGVIALLGVAYLLFGDPRVRLGLSVALTLEGILAALLPGVLIGVCDHPHMNCRLATLPALNVIGLGTALLAVVNALYLYKFYKAPDIPGNA
ncbi:MAG: DUF4418 family protein [Synergistaceae bacterium]|jgi:hypothetical protein|nr:DUF4418 family protein [Synergistaceae bacterium]